MFLKIGFGQIGDVAHDYTDIVEVSNVKHIENVTALLFAGKTGGQLKQEKKLTTVNFSINDVIVKHVFHSFYTARSTHSQRGRLEDYVYNTVYNSLLTTRQKKEKNLSVVFAEYGREFIPSPLDVGLLCLKGILKSMYQLNQVQKHSNFCLNMNTMERMEVVQHLLLLCADQVGLTIHKGEVEIVTPNDVRLLHDALHASGLSKKKILKEGSVHRGLLARRKEISSINSYPNAAATLAKFQMNERAENIEKMEIDENGESSEKCELKLMTHPSSVISHLDDEQIKEVSTLGSLLDVRTVFSTIVKKARTLDLCHDFLMIDPSILLEYETTGMISIGDSSVEEFRRKSGDVLLPYLHQNLKPELNHFILFRANFAEKKLFVYDSIWKHNSEMATQMIRRFLHAEDLEVERVRVPQQQRDFLGNTCGYHVIKNAMNILQGRQIPHKHDIDYFRREVMRAWQITGEPFNPTGNDTIYPEENMITVEQKMRRRRFSKNEVVDDSMTIQVNDRPFKCAMEEFVPEGYDDKTGCDCCDSRKFITEPKGSCCKNGKCIMKEPQVPPNLMYDLFAGVHPKSAHFESNVLLYNSLLSFASLERHKMELDPHGPQPAKERGPLYTHVSELRSRTKPRFANFYTLETFEATKARCEEARNITKTGGSVDETLLDELGQFFAKHNCFAILYHNFNEIVQKLDEKKMQPRQVYMRLLDRYEIKKSMTSTHAGCFNVPANGDTVSVIYDGRTDEALQLPDFSSYPKFTKQQLKRIKIKGQLPKSVNVYQYTRDPDDGIPRMPIRHWAPMSEPMAYALITPYGDYLFRGASMEQHPVGTHVDSLLKDDPHSIAHIKVDKNGYPINYPPDDRSQPMKKKTEKKKEKIEKEEMVKEKADADSIHEVNVRDVVQTGADDLKMQVHQFEDINGEEIPIPHKKVEEAREELMDVDTSSDESENEESDHEDPNFSNSSSDEEMLSDVKARIKREADVMQMETDEEIQKKTEQELKKHFEEEFKEFMQGNPQARHVSRRQYAAYALQTRPWNLLLNYHPLFSTGKLGQLYIIDQFMRILDDMTSYSAKKRVQKLRANKNRLFTYLAKIAIKRKVTIGTVTTLPFNFPESPRWYKTLFENAIAIMNKVGPPDLFLTMTANPDQPEIRKNMIGGATKKWENNSALVCKSFHARMEELFNDILGKKDRQGKRPMKGIFGKVVAFVYSTEFQARGLPHIHMLITLHPEDKLDTPEKVNAVIKAEVPEITENMTPKEKERVLDLREKVLKRMQHTMCQNNPNVKCLKNKKEHWKTCQKRFPKDFVEETSINEDGYAKLMRRNTNELNRWIVPYNPYLLQKHNCHINVEHCASVHSIKYIFKYIYKGVDKILMEVTDALHNENRSKTKKLTVVDHLILPKEILQKLSPGAKSRLNDNAIRTLSSQGVPLHVEGNKVVSYDEGAILKECRVVTAIEAAWKLLSLPMHGESHVVDTLFVHEENQEDIVFDDEDDPEEIKKLAEAHVTRLMAYFKVMKDQQKRGEPVISYLDLPRFYRFEKKEWHPRVYHTEERHIGYIKPVQPRFQQLFALRELSRVVPATGFEDYLHYNGKRYENFLEAARARRLINGEDEWEEAMKEVVQREQPSTIRMMFSQILIFGNPKRPRALYDKFESEMFNYRWPEEYARAHSLHHIRSYLHIHGRTLEDFSLPKVNEQTLKESRNYGMIEDESTDAIIDIADEKRLADEMREQLNDDQLTAADQIWKVILHPGNSRYRCLFLTGSGGTGKTFVYNYLYHRVNGTQFNDEYGDRVEMTAHTGVAATLLKNGTTVHSRFGLPLNMDQNSHSSIDVDKETRRAKELRSLRVLFWDESTMSSCWMFKVIDELLRKVRGIDKPFGGVVVVCGGDWKQLLPVSIKGGPVDARNLSLKKSNFWKLFKTITLHKNIRAQADPGFMEFIEDIGRGKNEVSEGRSYQVEIPKSMVSDDLNKMIFDLFGGNKLNDPYSIRHSALLTVLNKDSLELNKKILRQLHTFEKKYLSIDMPVEQRSLTVLAPETFHSLTPTGLPPHELILKKNCIVILLKNLCVAKGLCNGTKLIVKDLGENVIHCETLPEGTDAGQRVPIFRIPLKSPERMGEFQFQRTQFPLRLGYSMTINKSQEQTLDKVGIVLTNPVFAHGHLYVALSRARNHNDVRIYTGQPIEEDETAVVSNVVLTDMIDD